MKIKEKIGLIGVGNMGGAILEGLFKKKIAGPSQVWVYDKIGDKAAQFSQQWKANLASSNQDLVGKTEAVILAVKPQDLFDAAEEFKAALKSSHCVISILAGTPMSKIRKAVSGTFKIVRAMPNLGAKVGESVTALTSDDTKGEGLALAEQIFSGCGKTVRLEEKHFDLVTAVSGSGPAYFFLMMELLMKEGIQNGLSEAEAKTLAVQTAVGAGLLAQASISSPEELRKMVTSKGGTTEAALKILESKNFPEIFHEALQAALKRGRELSQ
ncbi:MAG: pyrroline-5-carboxylate reductase [Candidatus Omnitrophica bacterium]|nr:pyrroline-5-carboxylate reductase [Candidatus Omnitrophota bacterium]